MSEDQTNDPSKPGRVHVTLPKEKCAARGCAQPIVGGAFMCEPHWKLIPRPMQRTLVSADPRSDRWQVAADSAVAFVEYRERKGAT